VKILLDENLPRKLVTALRAEGHDVESIHTLRLQGLDNGKLYEFARDSFDICFTRDVGFANNVRQGAPPSRLKLLRVTVQQKPQDEFVLDFISVFRATDWTQFSHGDDWPQSDDAS
jgi:predicted nuclease of predicted toxin-antitoxin system